MNKYLGIPDKNEIIEIYNVLKKNDFKESYKLLLDFFRSAKWTTYEFIKYIFKELVIDEEINIINKNIIIKDLSKIESNIKGCGGGDSEINLAFLAITFTNNYKI